MTELESLTRRMARIFISLVRLAFPGQNAEIMARGILIEEIHKQDSSPIDML
jgi:hypothetical protein